MPLRHITYMPCYTARTKRRDFGRKAVKVVEFLKVNGGFQISDVRPVVYMNRESDWNVLICACPHVAEEANQDIIRKIQNFCK